MPTLDALVDLCEADLKDAGNATWTAADITSWLRDSIREYNQHFPRTALATITTQVAKQNYALSFDAVEVVQVEYPVDDDPPTFLKRRRHTHPEFWQVDGYYDFRPRSDATNEPELLISTSPTAIEDIDVIFIQQHDADTIIGSGAVTVPNRHTQILRAYVLWQATLQRKFVQEASPTSNSSLLMSQLAFNADRLRRAYLDRLSKAIQAEPRPPAAVSWADQTDDTTRIY